jgi:hypothetical protein
MSNPRSPSVRLMLLRVGAPWRQLTGGANACGACAMGISVAFATRWGERYLRTPDGRSRRRADIAVRSLGRLSWAESRPRRVASGRTGVSAKAAIPLRARNTLHRPKHVFISAQWTFAGGGLRSSLERTATGSGRLHVNRRKSAFNRDPPDYSCAGQHKRRRDG